MVMDPEDNDDFWMDGIHTDEEDNNEAEEKNEDEKEETDNKHGQNMICKDASDTTHDSLTEEIEVAETLNTYVIPSSESIKDRNSSHKECGRGQEGSEKTQPGNYDQEALHRVTCQHVHIPTPESVTSYQMDTSRDDSALGARLEETSERAENQLIIPDRPNPQLSQCQQDDVPLDNVTSSYKAKSLNVFNVTGNTGVKVVHQHGQGNSGSVLKNILDQSKLRLEGDLNMELFVKTSKIQQCEEQLKTWGMVTITGGSGEGKTIAGLYLLKVMSDTDSRQPLILTDPSQWDLIPTSQHKKNKFTVLIDDAFGRTNLVEDLRNRWELKFPMVTPLIEAGKVSLIITSRTNIYDLCCENLKCLEGLNHCHSEYSSTELTEVERLDLLENHMRVFRKNIKMSENEKRKIIQSENLTSFPLFCFLFTAKGQFHRDCFNKPHKHLLQSVREMQQKDPVAHLVLLLVVIYDNRLPAHALQTSEQSDYDIDTLKKLKQLCRMSSSVRLETVLATAHSLCMAYLKWDEKRQEFSFLHHSMYDTVFVEFCKTNITKGIEMCHVSSLLEYVRTKDDNETELIVFVSRTRFKDLANRLTKELMSANQQLVVTHPAFKDKEFRKFLYHFWSKEIKIELVLSKGGKQHIQSEQYLCKDTFSYLLDKCLNQLTGDEHFTSNIFEAFEYESILAFFVMNGADRIALHLFSFAKETQNQHYVSKLLDDMLVCSFYRNNLHLIEELIALGAEVNIECFLAFCISPEAGSVITDLAVEVLEDVSSIELMKHLFMLCLENGKLNVVHKLLEWIYLKTSPSEMCLQLLILTHSATPAWLQISKSEATFVEETVQILFDLGADCIPDEYVSVAAGCNSVSVLRVLLNRQVNVNCRSRKQLTPLHFAALYGSVQNVQLLLHHKADVLVTDVDGYSPLHFAVQSLIEAPEKVEILLKRSDIECRTKGGETALCLAIRKGDPGCTECLCAEMRKHHIDLDRSFHDAVRKLFQTLHVLYGGAENSFQTERFKHRLEVVNIVKAFCSKGTAISTVPHLQLNILDDPYTVEDMLRGILSDDLLPILIHSTEYNLPSMFKVILEKLKSSTFKLLLHRLTEIMCVMAVEDDIKLQLVDAIRSAEINEINEGNEQGLTPLHIAASHGQCEAVKLLLERRAGINAKSHSGDSPLHFAAKVGHLEVAEYLIKSGANINTANNMNETPVMIANEHGKFAFMYMLIEEGAHLKQSDMNLIVNDTRTTTLLEFLAENDHIEIFTCLLERDKTLNVTHNVLKARLLIAAEHNHLDVVKYLVKRGVDINVTDKSKGTPLHYAAENGHFKIVLYLTERGADINFTSCCYVNITRVECAGERYNLETVKYLHDCHYISSSHGEIHDLNSVVEAGAEIYLTDKSKRTPLHGAAGNGYMKIVKLLVERGADVNLTCTGSIKVTSLCRAAQNGHMEIVKYLVEKGADVNLHGNMPITPLHVAAENGHVEIVKYLIEQGADTDIVDYKKSAPIHYAVKFGELEIAMFLVDSGADINMTDNTNKTPLHYTAEHGHTEIAMCLLARGAKINVTSNIGRIPLHYAAENGHAKLIQSLVERGANINITDMNGKTPLHYSAVRDDVAIIKCLVENGADVNVGDTGKKTSLHTSAEHGHIKVVIFLIEKGAVVNMTDSHKRTALHGSVKLGHKEVAIYLISKSADVKKADDKSKTPLHYAAQHGHIEIAKRLVSRGAIVNVADNNQKTPLHCAVEHGHTELVKCLVETGAIVNVADNNQKTPLHCAAEHGHTELVKCLVETGAMVNFADNNQKTPLHCAAEHGHTEIVKHLIERGACVNITHNSKRTPVHYAAENGKTEIVMCLIESDSAENFADNQKTPLHCAAEHGHTEIVKCLIEKGASVNITDNSKRTPVHWAAENGKTETIIYLVNRGADINCVDNNKKTPLFFASENGHIEIVSFLTDSYSNSNFLHHATMQIGKAVNHTDKSKKTPLHYASERGYIDVVKFLIDSGGDVNMSDNIKKTPLCAATEHGHTEIAMHLIQSGAVVNMFDKFNKTPLLYAAEPGHADIVKYLVVSGANVNDSAHSRRTALHYAANDGYTEIVRCLVDKGAKVNKTDCMNKAPLHLAVNGGHTEITMCLIEKGANVNKTDCMNKAALHYAADGGHIEIAKYLVENGANVNKLDCMNNVPLHYAAEHGHMEIIKHLVRRGADINKVNGLQKTPLLIAVEHHQTEITKYFLEAGGPVNISDREGRVPLHYAVEHGYTEIIKYLVKGGSNVSKLNHLQKAIVIAAEDDQSEIVKFFVERSTNESKKYSSTTPLRYAVEHGQIEIVKYLVGKGTAVNKTEDRRDPIFQHSSHFSPLNGAARNGHIEIVKYLVERGAKVNVAHNQMSHAKMFRLGRRGIRETHMYKVTPLYCAAENDHLDIVKYLVERGADSQKWTPLHGAAKHGHTEVVKYLVERGADVNEAHDQMCHKETFILGIRVVSVSDTYTVTPLHGAAHNGHFKTVMYLVERGADVNAAGYQKVTPLHGAAENGHIEIVRFLVERGADVNATDNQKKTPLHPAARYGHIQVVMFLVERGADVNAVDCQKKTPLFGALQYSHTELVTFLVEKGADTSEADN